ncbi:MAG: hypothetical protein D4R57_01000 [Verrucomicrobiales bacterium]|nr:MAG: hypothetical protein D4R57_01000 [Verrucomicrobiales bacterium]
MHDEAVMLQVRLKRLCRRNCILECAEGHALALDLCGGFLADLGGLDDERPRRVDGGDNHAEDGHGHHDFDEGEGARLFTERGCV